MKHLIQHLAFVIVILIIVLLFGLTSCAIAQDESHFNQPEPTYKGNGRYDYSHRNGIFYAPQIAIFQIKETGKLYIHADKLTNEKVNDTDIPCFISTDKRFETFRMLVEVKNCRYANNEDLSILRSDKGIMYVFLKYDDECGFTILYRSKDQERIDNDLERIENLSDLQPKSM